MIQVSLFIHKNIDLNIYLKLFSIFKNLVNGRFSKRKLIEMKVENESSELDDTLNDMNNLSLKMDQD